VPSFEAAPPPAVTRALAGASAFALAMRLAGHVALAAQGRYFASDDDGYRAYLGYLLSRGNGPVAGRFWLPGQMLALAGLDRVGVDAATGLLVLGAITSVAIVLAARSLARDLAPRGWGDAAAWGATFIVLASPLELFLAHSGLSEPLSNALALSAAALLVRRMCGGSRWMLFASSIALGLATWVRYETWLLVGVWPVAAYIAARTRGERVVHAIADAAIASLPGLGPLGWFVAQGRTYGDPVAFIVEAQIIQLVTGGKPSPPHVLAKRATAVALWSPAAIAFALGALAAVRSRRRLAPFAWIVFFGATAVTLEILSGRGLGVFVRGGREIDMFSPRLVSAFALSLAPLAGLGVAALAGLALDGRARAAKAGALAIACGAAVAAVGVAPLRGVEFGDASSVACGIKLRRGELDDRIGEGALLIERVQQRPPMGWASVGVLWGRWDRMIWATPQGATWLLVEPTDVHAKRTRLERENLGDFLSRRGVSAAWTVSDEVRDEVLRAWPDARVTRIGDGALVSRDSR
jgi:hypothetical protein